MIDDEVDTIRPDGDTILIIGAAKRRYRVSSKRLSEASSVFAALFGPHFREGQKERSAFNPVEITLPDDDWRAMRRIFNMLHGSLSSEQGSTWWSGELLDFAISVDKYDLVDALRFGASAIFSQWFRDRSTCPNVRVLGQMMAAAYLLEDEGAFRLGTKQIVRLSTDRMTDLCGEKCVQILPPFVLVALGEQRSMAQNMINRLLMGLERRSRCLSCAENEPDKFIYPFQEKLAHEVGAQFWPPPFFITLQSIFDKITELGSRGQPMGCGHQDYSLKQNQLNSLLHSVDIVSRGLCLSCVHEDDCARAAVCIEH